MPSPRHFYLAALVALAGCDLDVSGPTKTSGSAGPNCFISCPPSQTAPAGYKIIEITPLRGSVTGGSIVIRNINQAAPELDGIVSFALADLGAEGSGARYPMHIHKGSVCSAVGAPIVHDLGAPVSALNWIAVPPLPVPQQYLMSGYYFDVHAASDPNGAPTGCALFAW